MDFQVWPSGVGHGTHVHSLKMFSGNYIQPKEKILSNSLRLFGVTNLKKKMLLYDDGKCLEPLVPKGTISWLRTLSFSLGKYVNPNGGSCSLSPVPPIPLAWVHHFQIGLISRNYVIFMMKMIEFESIYAESLWSVYYPRLRPISTLNSFLFCVFYLISLFYISLPPSVLPSLHASLFLLPFPISPFLHVYLYKYMNMHIFTYVHSYICMHAYWFLLSIRSLR